MRKVAVVAVHPDDEAIGCGGTLLRHKAQGDEIHWIICTSMYEVEGFSSERVTSRDAEIDKVAGMFGFDGVHQLGLKTMRVDEYDASTLVGHFSRIFSLIQPEVVYLPFKSDVHSDHRHIFNAAFACTKSFRYPYIKRVLMMETASETEFAPATKEDVFLPNVFVDISPYFERKLEILQVFKSEFAPHPFPRSLRNAEALAVHRGATAGCEYAESFSLLKEIQK
ncbi:PIG-L family deacetylase (plasmid) [Ensifer adhaerens]|uniref:PIG-L deacetylase family protein n=1 Tax=Ensifer TaxID=106591 RepID=UPI002100A116|nr:PIG-L deacetylase family protein [Ensifer adhaerens]UTV39266.1 PIG-L family deacetylase [Ensifer adhaerens]